MNQTVYDVSYNYMKILNIVRNKKGQFIKIWDRHRIKTNCLLCKKEFETVESRIKSGKAKYCSKECFNKTTKGRRRNIATEFKKGQISLRNGKTFPDMSGKNHWNWKNGITKLSKRIRNLPKNKKWKKLIFERDDWTCQECFERGCFIEAHHIEPFSKILKDNNIKTIKDALDCNKLWDVSNGLALCKKCHNKTKGKKK